MWRPKRSIAESAAPTLETVKIRLERLSERARRYIEAAAVLGDRTQTWQPARLCGLRIEEIDDTIAELVDAALLVANDPVEFAHPLIRSTVEAGLSRAAAAGLHADAAQLLDETGAPVERVAHHIANAEPSGDPWRAKILRQAAKRARVTGNPRDAAAWLRRALIEADGDDIVRQLLPELAEAEATAGSADWSDLYARARLACSSVTDRAELARRIGRGLGGRRCRPS